MRRVSRISRPGTALTSARASSSRTQSAPGVSQPPETRKIARAQLVPCGLVAFAGAKEERKRRRHVDVGNRVRRRHAGIPLTHGYSRRRDDTADTVPVNSPRPNELALAVKLTASFDLLVEVWKHASVVTSDGAGRTRAVLTIDLKNDPDEMHNLALEREKHAETILRLNGLLNDLMAREVGVNDGRFLPDAVRSKK